MAAVFKLLTGNEWNYVHYYVTFIEDFKWFHNQDFSSLNEPNDLVSQAQQYSNIFLSD